MNQLETERKRCDAPTAPACAQPCPVDAQSPEREPEVRRVRMVRTNGMEVDPPEAPESHGMALVPYQAMPPAESDTTQGGELQQPTNPPIAPSLLQAAQIVLPVMGNMSYQLGNVVARQDYNERYSDAVGQATAMLQSQVGITNRGIQNLEQQTQEGFSQANQYLATFERKTENAVDHLNSRVKNIEGKLVDLEGQFYQSHGDDQLRHAAHSPMLQQMVNIKEELKALSREMEDLGSHPTMVAIQDSLDSLQGGVAHLLAEIKQIMMDPPIPIEILERVDRFELQAGAHQERIERLEDHAQENARVLYQVQGQMSVMAIQLKELSLSIQAINASAQESSLRVEDVQKYLAGDLVGPKGENVLKEIAELRLSHQKCFYGRKNVRKRGRPQARKTPGVVGRTWKKIAQLVLGQVLPVVFEKITSLASQEEDIKKMQAQFATQEMFREARVQAIGDQLASRLAALSVSPTPPLPNITGHGENAKKNTAHLEMTEKTAERRPENPETTTASAPTPTPTTSGVPSKPPPPRPAHCLACATLVQLGTQWGGDI